MRKSQNLDRPLLLAIVACWLSGCKSDPILQIETPDQLTLYSIDGYSNPSNQASKPNELLHGIPIVGTVQVTDAVARKEIIEALNNGIAESDGSSAGCFWPRHAIRTVKNGRTVDHVICFECNNLITYEGNAETGTTTTRSPQAVLNKHLKAAGVPLAPGMVDSD